MVEVDGWKDLKVPPIFGNTHWTRAIMKTGEGSSLSRNSILSGLYSEYCIISFRIVFISAGSSFGFDAIALEMENSD